MSATATEALPTTGLWTIDSAHSTVNFSVIHHAVASFRSGFVGISGAYDADAGKLTGEVRADSITITNPALERLRNHLLTPDFFAAEDFPVFSFASTEVSPAGEGWVVEGEITLRGVTKPVTANAVVRGPQNVLHGDGKVTERFGIDLSAVIDRREFGILRNNEIAEGILNLGWDVQIEAALELFLATPE
jgi:polyisoprenoid-binding protein YceI